MWLPFFSWFVEITTERLAALRAARLPRSNNGAVGNQGHTPAWPAGVSDELIAGALDQLAEAVTVHDTQRQLLYANQAAIELLGFDSVDEMLSAEPGELINRYRVFHPDGRPVDQADLPGRRVLLGEEPEPLLVRWFTLRDDQLRWSLIKARALRNADGELLGAVNVMQDVTIVQEAEFAQRLLADAGETFATSMDHTQTLQHVAEMAVPRLADWCGVDLVDHRGEIQQVAVAHADPEKIEFGREFRRRYPITPDDPQGVPAVIRSGELELIQDITDDMIVGAALNAEHLAAMRELELHSVLIVPLRAPHGVIGALSLVMSGEGRRFSPGDVALAQELARRAGSAVENARVFTERGRIAELLQASLIPTELPAVPGWATATLFRPAGDVNLVGGDFYDARAVDDGLLVCVGDVAGKGASAAGTTGRVRYALMTAVAFTGELPLAFAHVNSLLMTPGKRGMCTVAAAQLSRTDDGGASAIIGLAGHPRPVLLREGDARFIEARGAMFGAFPDASWDVTTLDLERGDVLIFYTDGVTDAVGNGERFGSERLMECVRGAPRGAGAVVGALERQLQGFEHGPQRDDIALLAVEFMG
jgi:serine phosphatase RsbU (regulator of sigma subunit)/PAS domain-containing protein